MNNLALIIIILLGYCAANCPVITPDYHVKIPYDLGPHYNMSEDDWWIIGNLKDSFDNRYGFLYGVHLINPSCNMSLDNSYLLYVRLLLNVTEQIIYKNVSIVSVAELSAGDNPYYISTDSKNYFKKCLSYLAGLFVFKNFAELSDFTK